MSKRKFNNVGLFYNPKHFKSLKPLKKKLETLMDNRFNLYVLAQQKNGIFKNINYVDSFKNEQIDLVIGFGGDGTMLEILKHVLKENIPVLGFNHGKVGFLSECEKNEFAEVIDKLMHNQFKIEKRNVLECNVNDKKYFAINDIEINRGDLPHTININAYLDKNLLFRIIGDGVIVATPTGSTAYSMAAGGSVLHPECNSFIITPNNPHNQFSKPVVVSASTNIVLEFVKEEHKAIMNIDGVNVCELSGNERILLKNSNYLCKFIKLAGKDFCRIIRQKFNFGA